jgi:hypothetical protein
MGTFLCKRCKKQWPDVVYFSCPECHPRWAFFQGMLMFTYYIGCGLMFGVAFLAAIAWFLGWLS